MSTTTRLAMWQHAARCLRHGKLAYLWPVVPRCQRKDAQREMMK